MLRSSHPCLKDLGILNPTLDWYTEFKKDRGIAVENLLGARLKLRTSNQAGYLFNFIEPKKLVILSKYFRFRNGSIKVLPTFLIHAISRPKF